MEEINKLNTNTTEVETENTDTSTEETGASETLFANKYKTREDLTKGVNNIGSNLPDYILEGLSDKALELHYLELQKEFSKSGKKIEEETTTTNTGTNDSDTNTKTETDTNTDEIKKLDSEAKDYNKILLENYKAENLSELLEGSGFTEDFINAFKAGQEAIIAQQTIDVYKDIGGVDKYNELVEWASKNLSKDDKEAFNSVIDSGDKKQIKFNINNLFKRYEVENKTPLMGDKSKSIKQDVYASREEMYRDMRDPRYKTDPVFQKEVLAKAKRSM